MKPPSIQETIARALKAAGVMGASYSSSGLYKPMRTPMVALSKDLFERVRAEAAALTGNSLESKAVGGMHDASLGGQFLQLTQPKGPGCRSFKLYVPSCFVGQPLPLIVMLHGCKQNPDDFATGTRMNALAEREGFFVAYPAQTVRDNGANCWNWFDLAQQVRGGAEPASLVDMVERIRRDYNVDGSRIFVAGLSAGAAMAVILGAAYPETFAAVAAHSGLPLGAARDVASAFAAMKGGGASGPHPIAGPAIPTLVFHGKADTTVALDNGMSITQAAVASYRAANIALVERAELVQTEPHSKETTVTRYLDSAGRVQVEQWLVTGAGHAWFGGDSRGSYTDPTGPDATAMIVDFFWKVGRGGMSR